MKSFAVWAAILISAAMPAWADDAFAERFTDALTNAYPGRIVELRGCWLRQIEPVGHNLPYAREQNNYLGDFQIDTDPALYLDYDPSDYPNGFDPSAYDQKSPVTIVFGLRPEVKAAQADNIDAYNEASVAAIASDLPGLMQALQQPQTSVEEKTVATKELSDRLMNGDFGIVLQRNFESWLRRGGPPYNVNAKQRLDLTIADDNHRELVEGLRNWQSLHCPPE